MPKGMWTHATFHVWYDMPYAFILIKITRFILRFQQVAVGRVQPSNLQNYKPRGTTGKESLVNDSSLRPRSLNFEFISRHTIDGKFVFVDQR